MSTSAGFLLTLAVGQPRENQEDQKWKGQGFAPRTLANGLSLWMLQTSSFTATSLSMEHLPSSWKLSSETPESSRQSGQESTPLHIACLPLLSVCEAPLQFFANNNFALIFFYRNCNQLGHEYRNDS